MTSACIIVDCAMTLSLSRKPNILYHQYFFDYIFIFVGAFLSLWVQEREQFDRIDKEADEWRAGEIAKEIAKRKVPMLQDIIFLMQLGCFPICNFRCFSSWSFKLSAALNLLLDNSSKAVKNLKQLKKPEPM